MRSTGSHVRRHTHPPPSCTTTTPLTPPPPSTRSLAGLVASGRGSSQSQHPSYSLFCPKPLPTAPHDLGMIVTHTTPAAADASMDPRLAPWSPSKVTTAHHAKAADTGLDAAPPA